MAVNRHFFYILVILLAMTNVYVVDSLFIDGCPIYGCRPSGSFSFSQTLPRDNVSVNWMSQFLLEPVPFAAGCVADSVNIVCLSNGPFTEDKGYISIDGGNGTLLWKDKILEYPTLPMLDNYGDVTGTDGYSLVHYDQDGKKYPIINVRGLAPVFNIQLVGTMFLLMVSENGGLYVRDTNAIPVAAIFLNDTVQRTNGTFIPISQPVVNGQRFYVLTEFVPTSSTNDKTILNLQRLYAIDIHHRMANIMTIAWYYNFEMEDTDSNKNDKVDLDKLTLDDFVANIKENRRSKQILLWNYATKTVYVTLPPPYKYGTKSHNQPNTFWALKDDGNDTSLAFKSSLDVTHMATYEKNDEDIDTDIATSLWISTSESILISITANGTTTKTIDLNDLVGATVAITSKLSLIRENNTATDSFVFGIKVLSGKLGANTVSNHIVNANYVVAIETVPEQGQILWKIPVPNGLEVKGQITGSRGADYQRKDQLVMYADDGANASKIISLA